MKEWRNNNEIINEQVIYHQKLSIKKSFKNGKSIFIKKREYCKRYLDKTSSSFLLQKSSTIFSGSIESRVSDSIFKSARSF